MGAIQQIFQRYGAEYIDRYGQSMPPSHHKVIDAICNCRNGDLGASLYACQGCGSLHIALSSCGNRHCPTCQHEKADKWLAERLKQLLPCPYFLITFTVPKELRPFIRSHQRLGYEAMFRAASSALKTLAKDKRFIGAEKVGFFGVLHTWGQQLQYHPHIHFIVPAGGLSEDGSKWLASGKTFYVHVKALSKLFKGKLRAAFKQKDILHKIDPTVWHKDWSVNSQAVGDGTTSLKYLAPYVFRVAISNHRIISYENDEITFRYRKGKSTRSRTTSLHAIEFMRRFLQHVLPTGFMKIRHYGFLHANSKVPLPQIHQLITALCELVAQLPPPAAKPKAKHLTCRHCGQMLRLLLFIPRLFQPPRLIKASL